MCRLFISLLALVILMSVLVVVGVSALGIVLFALIWISGLFAVLMLDSYGKRK